MAVHRVQLWPDGQLELGYRFVRDISGRLKWCLLEDETGGDIAGADFEPFIGVCSGAAGARSRQVTGRNDATLRRCSARA